MDTTITAPAVYQAIAAVSAEIAKAGIAKDRTNEQQHYRFRGIDDVHNALAPLLAKHGLVILPRMINRILVERPARSGGVLFAVTVEAEFDFVGVADGSIHTVRMFGEAMDSADKATNKAMSAAYKYAAFQAFCIPTEGSDDADAQTPDVAGPSAIARELERTVAQAVENAQPASNGGQTIGTLIRKVDDATVKSTGRPKWYVHFEDGNKASTIDVKLAETAKRIRSAGARVQPELKKTEWGYDLMALYVVPGQAPKAPPAPPVPSEHTAPLTDDDIPF